MAIRAPDGAKKDHKRLMLFKLISEANEKGTFFRSTKPVVDWVSYSGMTIVMNIKHNNMYATTEVEFVHAVTAGGSVNFLLAV